MLSQLSTARQESGQKEEYEIHWTCTEEVQAASLMTENDGFTLLE